MPSTRIKERISTLVSSQVPEFVRSDFPVFVDFLEAYYSFLEQDQSAHELIQNSRDYADIDLTASSFVEYLLKNYTYLAPVSSPLNKAILLKRIKDLYESKGSEVSFKLLFRLLYDTNAEITYPYENVLRPSNGQWSTQFSIRVTTIAGDPTLLRGRFLSYSRSNVSYSIPILKTKKLTDTLYEFFLDQNSLAPFVVGDEVQVFSPGSVTTFDFRGTIAPTTTTVAITSTGSGFRVGQIFNINIGSGIGTQVKIKEVSPTGGVRKVEIISFGYNYTSNFSIFIIPNSNIAQSANSFQARTRGTLDTISFLKNQTASTTSSLKYFDDEYSLYSDAYLGFQFKDSQSEGTFVGDFSVESVSPDIQTSCALSFTLGALAKYPGSYISNRGQISNSDIKVQSRLLYQPFAYLIESEIDISKFYETVKQLVHPAGQNLFNNRLIFSDINVYANVNIQATANINTELFDIIRVGEQIEIEQSKVLSAVEDSVETINEDNEFVANIQINVPALTSSVIITDVAPDVTAFDYFLNTFEILTADDSQLFTVTISVSDTFTVPDTPILTINSTYNEEIFTFNDILTGRLFVHNYTANANVSDPNRYFDDPQDYVLSPDGTLVISDIPAISSTFDDVVSIDDNRITADYINLNYIVNYVDNYVGTITRIFPYSNINIDTDIVSTTDQLQLANVDYADQAYFNEDYTVQLIFTI